MVKVGDRLIVQGSEFPAYVETVWYDEATAQTVIELDWREYGRSKVYLHDEGKTWHKFIDVN